jgi:hypothetical protein
MSVNEGSTPYPHEAIRKLLFYDGDTAGLIGAMMCFEIGFLFYYSGTGLIEASGYIGVVIAFFGGLMIRSFWRMVFGL